MEDKDELTINEDKDIDKDIDKETDDEKEDYSKFCYMCRRTEKQAGKLIYMPPNIYICPECMQKTFDTINKDLSFEEMCNQMDLMSMNRGF